MKFPPYACILLITSLTAIIKDARAQLDSRSFLSVTAGYSLPVGELAREKIDDPFAGLTGSGRYIQANYDFRIARWIGLRVTGNMNINTTRPQPIVDRANEKVDEIKPLINETTAQSWDTSVSKWKFNSLMIGPAIYINMGRVQLEGHVMGGYVQVSSPTVHMIGRFESGKNAMDVRLNEASTNDFGVGAGASLRIPVFKALYIHLSGDFLATEAELKDVALRVNIQGYPEVGIPINEKRFVGVANVGFGLGLAF